LGKYRRAADIDGLLEAIEKINYGVLEGRIQFPAITFLA
jgi:hypothetical protein